MSNEDSIIILFFGFFIVFFGLIIWYTIKQNQITMNKFADRGFIKLKSTVDDYFEFKKFRNIAKDITIEIRKFYDYSTYEISYKLILTTPSIQTYQFSMKKQKRNSKTAKTGDRALEGLEKFDITTTSPNHVRFIMSELEIDKFNDFFFSAYSLDVKSQDGLLEIIVELKAHIPYLFISVDFIDFILPKLLSGVPLEGIDYEEYICFNCQSKLAYAGDICSSCGVIAPKCVICFDDPEPNEMVILFDCCKSYAHKQHAKLWIKINNICPSCRSEAPMLKPVMDQENK